MPWRETSRPSGYCPLVKIGTTLSHHLYLVRSTGWMMPRGTVYKEEEFGIRDIQGFRLGHETVQERGVIRGLHLDLEAEVLGRLARDVDDRRYRPPTWSRVTSLMFCAQIVGKPEIAPEPAARPALAAAPFRMVRSRPCGLRHPCRGDGPLAGFVSHVSLPVLPRASAWPRVPAAATRFCLIPFSPNSAGHRRGARWPLGFTDQFRSVRGSAMRDRGQAGMRSPAVIAMSSSFSSGASGQIQRAEQAQDGL